MLCVWTQGLASTLFERLQTLYGEGVSHMLTVQYRMHASIMAWSSNELYEGRVRAHPSVAGHSLADLPVSKRPQGIHCLQCITDLYSMLTPCEQNIIGCVM